MAIMRDDGMGVTLINKPSNDTTSSEILKHEFEAKAREVVEPIIKNQSLIKALYDHSAGDIQAINDLMKQVGIDKAIKWEITGDNKTHLTLSVENDIKMQFKAEQDGQFHVSHPLGEHVLMCTTGQLMRNAIAYTNDVVKNHILNAEEMKKVGLALNAKNARGTGGICPHNAGGGMM